MAPIKLFYTAAVAYFTSLAYAATTNTNLQTSFPKSSGTSALAAVKTIAAGATFGDSFTSAELDNLANYDC
jgi:hypothetical protein